MGHVDKNKVGFSDQILWSTLSVIVFNFKKKERRPDKVLKWGNFKYNHKINKEPRSVFLFFI